MWDLPRPGIELVSPALAGGFSTTAPPGKSTFAIFYWLEFAGPAHSQGEGIMQGVNMKLP